MKQFDVEFTTNWVYFTLLKWMKKGPIKDSIKDIMAGFSVLALILALRNMKCQEYIIILEDSSALEGIQCRNLQWYIVLAKRSRANRDSAFQLQN